jgi:hypothetical protein
MPAEWLAEFEIFLDRYQFVAREMHHTFDFSELRRHFGS